MANPLSDLGRETAQRNQAIACAILSLIISIALVMNQFLDRRQDLIDANAQILSLQQAVKDNQLALLNTQQDLVRLLEAQANGVIKTREPALWLEWFSPRDKMHLSSVGASAPFSTTTVDRGQLNSGEGNQILRVGDELTLRPVIRAWDGNATGIRIEVLGPGITNASAVFVVSGRAVLGGDQWLFDHYKIRLPQQGVYTVAVTGYTIWPSMKYVVNYRLKVVSAED